MKRTMPRRDVLGRLAAGLAALPALAHPARAAAPIRMLSVTNESGMSPFYADQFGFFKKTGLDVEVGMQGKGGGAAILAAVVGGAADIGQANPISLALAYKRGAPIVAFAPTAIYRTKACTAYLLVAQNSPIKTASDLNGKTIAVIGVKDTTQLATQMWIDKNGGDSATVKFVEMPFTDMAPSLAGNRVDAAFCTEPTLTDALRSTRILADAFSAIGPEFFLGTFITSRAYAQANPETIRRLSDALRETALWANGHRRETAATLVRLSKIDPATIERMRRATFGERLTPQGLQPCIDLAARYGLLSASFPARDLIWQG
jgi:NitT/TauT family transport system substrate-binding protein